MKHTLGTLFLLFGIIFSGTDNFEITKESDVLVYSSYF